MKPKSKKQAILKALLDGQKLTTKSCMALCGTHKLTSRLPELEQEFGFKSIVKKVSSKSRYGGVDYYNQYWLSAEAVVNVRKKLAKNN